MIVMFTQFIQWLFGWIMPKKCEWIPIKHYSDVTWTDINGAVIDRIYYTIEYCKELHKVRMVYEGRWATEHKFYHKIAKPYYVRWQQVVATYSSEAVMKYIKNHIVGAGNTLNNPSNDDLPTHDLDTIIEDIKNGNTSSLDGVPTITIREMIDELLDSEEYEIIDKLQKVINEREKESK